ncbi:MAG: hypothetical protein P1U69_04275 [Parvibaculaceae bacterium]|nr:hypothetical protein [Parvibaculaceae bacterium]
MKTFVPAAFCLCLSSALFTSVLPVPPALANGQENPRTSPHYDVRERYNYQDPQAAYWEGFELKNEGDCEAAIERLRPLARNGRGYESAQHAYGLCLMSMGGLPTESGTEFNAEQVSGNEKFQQGRTWVMRAANAGHFQAQRTLLALYAANIGPNKDPVEIGKWLRLYDVNPLRLTLGAIDQNDGLRAHLRNTINRTDYLDGKELARNWTPTYWAPPGVQGQR